MSDPRTQIGCRTSTREQCLRPLLRAGESWDTLLRKMAAQYDPEAAADEDGREFNNRTAPNYTERPAQQ